MLKKDQAHKRPTRAQVAEMAGVSVATVSYVVNESSKPVAKETRQRVLKVVKELGYIPHAIARSLKTGNSDIVGLVVPVISSPGMALMTSLVQDELMSHGYKVILTNTHENPKTEAKMLEVLLAQYVEGIILCPASRFHSEPYQQIREMGIPIVFIDRRVNGFLTATVMTNNRKAGREGTQLLIRQGCRHIVCLSFNCLASSAYERVSGYRNALKVAGIPVDENAIIYFEEPSAVAESFKNYIKQYPVPDGVICTNQDVGIELLKTINQLKIPIDNRNIVIFDADWGRFLTPPVPVVLQNFREVARTATAMMLAKLKGEPLKRQFITVDADLVC